MGKRHPGIDILKALAIIAVVLIHTENTIFTFVKDKTAITIIVAFDQILRFCVPLFVTLSAYLLAGKYLHSSLRIKAFLKKRVFSLLPAYLLASALIYFYLHNFSKEPQGSFNIFQILFLGRADYHLYFVPMLFQLYLLFPLLIFLYKRKPKAALLGALVIQGAVLAFTYAISEKLIKVPFPWFDQQQYVFGFSWIFYFVLGIFLYDFQSAGKLARAVKITIPFVVAALAFSIINGIAVYKQSGQILPATSFTRFPVLFFATTFCALAIGVLGKVENIGGLAGRLLASVGKNSYHIYLIHTLVIRLVFEYFKPMNFASFVIFVLAVVYFSYLYSLIFGELSLLWRRKSG